MQLRVRAPDELLPHAGRLRLKRRLRVALGRTAAAVTHTEAILSPVPSARGGAHCRITASLQSGAGVHVEDHGPSLEDAAATAIWKSNQRLERIRAGSPERVHGSTQETRKRA